MINEIYIVYSQGRDCDGYACHEEYEFDSKYEAELFASDCNSGSDGLRYYVKTEKNEKIRMV